MTTTRISHPEVQRLEQHTRFNLDSRFTFPVQDILATENLLLNLVTVGAQAAHGRASSEELMLKLPVQPVSKQLATTTDLEPEAVEAIVSALNPLIADALAVYLKTKNFHWHMSGSHFRDYHLMLDEQADSLLGSVDPLAERVRKLGGSTLRSISQVSTLQTVRDDDEAFVEPLEMLGRLMKDNKHLGAAQRAAHGICEKNHDYGTSGLLETLIDETEKRTWFLFEAMQGGEHTR